MRIVLATPLYPPDIAEPAQYIKTLATRLRDAHDVTIVTYGHIPEEVPGVEIISVDKRRPLPIRIARYTIALLRTLRGADILFSENGPSAELPLIIGALFSRARVVFHIGDRAAHERAKERLFLSFLETVARKSAQAILNDIPPARPEILPFRPKPENELMGYEKQWALHREQLEHIFSP